MTSRFLLAVVGALLLSACSGKPPLQTTRPAATTTASSEIDAIANLLYEGKRKEARKRLDKALDHDPKNAALMMLKQSMTGDAREALGPASFPYVVQPGDTMTSLAARFLGNRLKAYQLAQYNGIDSPNDLAVGAVLRIPGQAPQASAAPRTASAPAPRAPAAAPTAPRTAAPQRAPAATKANLAGAKRAHAAGLTALNQGRVGEAVSQLRRAAALDPGNAAISRDLARAERIAATVRARD